MIIEKLEIIEIFNNVETGKFEYRFQSTSSVYESTTPNDYFIGDRALFIKVNNQLLALHPLSQLNLATIFYFLATFLTLFLLQKTYLKYSVFEYFESGKFACLLLFFAFLVIVRLILRKFRFLRRLEELGIRTNGKIIEIKVSKTTADMVPYKGVIEYTDVTEKLMKFEEHIGWDIDERDWLNKNVEICYYPNIDDFGIRTDTEWIYIRHILLLFFVLFFMILCVHNM